MPTDNDVMPVQGVASILSNAGLMAPKKDDESTSGSENFTSTNDGDGESHDQARDTSAGENPLNDGERAKPANDGGAGDRAKPTTLAELAEIAGLDLDDVYKIGVPMADGESLTLSALKDSQAQAGELDEARTTLDVDRETFQNEMLRARQELAEVIQLLPQLPPQLIEQAKQKHIETLDRERAALVGIMPEWADAATYNRAVDDMAKTAATYGLSRLDVESIVDHRVMKMLHDFTTLQARYAAANAKLKEVRETAPRPTRSGEAPPNKQPQQQSTRRASGPTAETAAKVGQVLRNAQQD